VGIAARPITACAKSLLQNWSPRLKLSVLLQVSIMALLGPFNAAVPNPSLNLLSAAFHTPVEIVTYSTTTSIITGGLSVSSAIRLLVPSL
jgi:hypothetical protein